jgi:primosomal protein N' (replication factor Y)
MIYVEVVVNVPIRRSFARRHNDPSSLPPPGFDGDADTASAIQFQTFHYHLPPGLEHRVAPGHLLWAPFGGQQVQGIVLRLTESAPVPTKAVDRLARPEPILTPVQLALAEWIAGYYVAPLSEAIKLFVPPGLLQKDAQARGVRAKRELEIAPAVARPSTSPILLTLGRDSQQARALAALLAEPTGAMARDALMARCAMKTDSALRGLMEKRLIAVTDQTASLAVSPSLARDALIDLRGLDRHLAVLDVLEKAGGPLWKSQLYARADADLKLLRSLAAAGLVTLTERVRMRDPLAGQHYPHTLAPALTDEQVAVWGRIEAAMSYSQSEAIKFLLHGVTGSGKTEIYLRTIAATLREGRQAIVLVPEIALTPQTVARFAGRFPGRVTVIHSAMSQGERYDVWRMIRAGEFDVVVGPRSALFAPLTSLWLIIIDEEHESSYKQNAEEWGSFTVFYDARTVADRLAELTGSLLISGSATPSMERYFAAVEGELTLLEMPSRVVGHTARPDLSVVADQDDDLATARSGNGLSGGPPPADMVPTAYAALPPVEIVDMRQELRAGHRSIFSRSLQSELHATLDAGEQAILFLNRRGSATFVMCRDCGAVQECPRCEIPLTYHERASVLVCHHCDRRYPIPEVCPVCASKRIKYFGSGTQRIEELVQQIAPRARLLRWDADTTGRRGSHAAILARFANHEADVLVGTQMIAKGLDLPLVTLVGVISADVGLYLPDFRSGERTFQLLTQVAGRAGRSVRGGRVVIQTYTPDHYAIQAAAEHDYAAFFDRELAFRREHQYPPVRRLARLIYWHKKLDAVKNETARMADVLRQRVAQMGLEAEWIGIIGPAPAFFARHRGYYRWHILVRAPDPAQLIHGLDIPFGWRVDIDPMSLL